MGGGKELELRAGSNPEKGQGVIINWPVAQDYTASDPC